MPSFYIPLSGLNADSTALNTIANNLSNMNTTGFKAQTTNFSDLFYQQVGTTGSGDEIQVGTGVQVASNSTNFTGGSISSTGVATDAAIDGSGFFVLDAGNGSQLYTRDGNFQVSSTGTLESTEGQPVMGYLATNGVINTSSGLADLSVPTGQVMQPSATTSFSMTQNLNSAAAVGATASGQVQVYDSLGKSYEATVTYTNLGNSKWSYAITLPDTLTAAAATAPAATTMAVTEATPVATSVTAATTVTEPSTTVSSPVSATTTTGVSTTQTNFALGSYIDPTTGNTTQAGIDGSTSLTITAPNTSGVSTPVAITLSNPAGESLVTYVSDINNQLATANVTGVTVTGTNGVLSIAGPSTMTVNGYVNQDILGTTVASSVAPTSPVTTTSTSTLPASAPAVNSTSATPISPVSDSTSNPGTTTETYTFAATGTIDINTSVSITGPTKGGGPPATTTITVTPSNAESVAAFYSDLSSALTASNIKTGVGGVNITNPSGNTITISGPTATLVANSPIKQDVALATTNYNFVTSNSTLANVASTSTLAITEGGTSVSVPAFSGTQTVATYASNLQSALTTAGITDVTVTGTSGVLSITKPSNATITGTVNESFTGAQSSFDFGSYTDPNTGLTTLATVAPTSTLTITAPTTAGTTTTITVAPSNPAGESVEQYAAEIQTKLNNSNVIGINISVSNGTLTITGPDTAKIAGSINQNMLGTTSNYVFQTNSTVDPTTNLKITGLTSTGSTATITAPTVTTGETVSQYATALTSALTTAGITNATASATNGQLSIVGANISTTGSLNQGLADTTITYNFGSSATVDTSTALTIVGPTVSGTPPTAITTAPAVTAGETVTQYAADLTKALTAAGIDTGTNGVSIKVDGGQLSIIGPAATLKTAGIASQDLTATTISYNFGTSGSSISSVDPKTNLTITGLTSSGSTKTTTAPTVTPGESLAQYVNDLNTSLSTAGIAGVTVTSTAGGQLSISGANLSTAGTVIQDPVSSANSSGTLTFDANGNLVNPTTNISNITFSGLSDNASTMNMNWGLLDATGKAEISQSASASGQSAQSQNGYTSGEYQSFTIGSNGTITAAYSNGQNQIVGQIGLASMSNLQGLADVGSTEYRTTTASGLATVGVAGSGGLGTLEGSSLEASNVNISAEFSDLIIAQRAFEANSKAVTTFDTITQETINMIH
jgi:flagellar hook protein FlgE